MANISPYTHQGYLEKILSKYIKIKSISLKFIPNNANDLKAAIIKTFQP